MSAADIVEIVNVVNLYPIAVDSLSFDLFDEIFLDDAHVDFGGPAQWRDLATMKRDFLAIHQPFEATQHNTSNHRVDVRGDTANCISYVIARFVRDVPEGGTLFEAFGWYDDFLERTRAGWRIKRRVNRTWGGRGNQAVMQTMPGVTVELRHHALSREGATGDVMFLNARSARH